MSIMTNVAVRKRMKDYVESRDHVIKLYSDGRRLMREADHHMAESCNFGIPGEAGCRRGVEEVTKDIDARYWREVFRRTGVTRLMDAQACKEFNDSLDRNPPTFSMANIESQYLTMAQDAEKMFRRGIFNSFKRLDPNYWTNNNKPYEISQRSILRGMFESNWSSGLRVNYYRSDEWNDIDRVIHVLDHKDHTPHSLETKLNAHFAENSEPYEDEYFQIKAFKNGNAHLLIKRDDLIDRINMEIAAYYNHDKLAEAA